MICNRICSKVPYYQERWMEERRTKEEELFVKVSEVREPELFIHVFNIRNIRIVTLLLCSDFILCYFLSGAVNKQCQKCMDQISHRKK